MNEAVEPALIALGGGTIALASIYAYEQRAQRRMRAGTVAHRITFPIGATEAQAAAAVRGLTGAPHGTEFVLEVRASPSGIRHFLHIPREASPAAHQISAALPGSRLDVELEDRAGAAISTLALRVHFPALSILRTEDSDSAARSMLGQLAQLQPGEQVRMYLAVREAEARVPDQAQETPAERERHRRLRGRIPEPTFCVGALVLARAKTKARARTLLDGIGQSLRSRLSQGRPLRLVYEHSGRRLGAKPAAPKRSATITAKELVGLAGWPLGDYPIPQVELGATRELLAARGVGRNGVSLFVGRDVAGERSVCLPPAAQRLHVFAAGATGSGKSTLIANVVLDSIAAGQAGLVLDPKDGSLVESIIERIPDEHRDRIVVVSPAAREAPVGVDLFAAGDPDTRAEAITATLRAIYGPQGAFGVRAEHYLPLSLRSLAALPNPNFLLIGRLFTDARLRQQAVARLKDPVLKLAWAAYDDLPPEAQRAHVAAPLNRLMGLLQRPPVRATLAQPSPRLNLGALWNERGWLLVDLAPGVVGEAAARLTGSLISFLALATLEERARQPASGRVPTNLVFDELQALSDLPVSIERLAERARSFAGQLFLATQATSRLPGPLADSIFGNFATIVSFKAGAGEAHRLAREFPGLEAADLMALPPFGVAARIATGTGTGVVTLTGHTEQLPARTGNADYIRQQSAARFGTPRAELEEAIAEQLTGDVLGAAARPAPGRAKRAS